MHIQPLITWLKRAKYLTWSPQILLFIFKIRNDQLRVWFIGPPVIPSWPKFNMPRCSRVIIWKDNLITITIAFFQGWNYLRRNRKSGSESRKHDKHNLGRTNKRTDLGQSFLPKILNKKSIRFLCWSGFTLSKAEKEMIRTSLVCCSNQ